MSEKKAERLKFLSLEDRTYVRFNFMLPFNFVLILKAVFFTLTLLYLGWEIYWAKKVGYVFMKWHTHFALYFYIWLFLALLLRLGNKLFGFKQQAKNQMLLTSICLTLLGAEIFLYTTGIGDTYMEHVNLGYASRYDVRYESYYRTHEPNKKYGIIRPEFNYSRQCNSLGFSDIEWIKGKHKGEKRILLCGDSFTEGVGAPYDSCYPSLLRHLLTAVDSSYYIMNSGIVGDDPCVNFVNYKDRLAVYHPDIIVQTLSSNDINTDIAVKGGLERFQKNGTIKLPPAPWWEPIYALSYVARIAFTAMGYNELLLKSQFTEREKTQLNKQAIETFSSYAKVTKENGAKLLVILQPCLIEIYQEKYNYDLKDITKELCRWNNIYVFDLMPYYLDEFANNKKEEERNYYWPQDGHHNSKGYYLMAKGVKQALDSFDLIIDVKAEQPK